AENVFLEHLPAVEERLAIERRPFEAPGRLAREPFLRMQDLLRRLGRILLVELLDLAPALLLDGENENEAFEIRADERLEDEGRNLVHGFDRGRNVAAERRSGARPKQGL